LIRLTQQYDGEDEQPLFELNKVIYLNQPEAEYVEPYDPNTMQLQMGNNYLCIYVDDGKMGSIIHYFTIIKTGDEKYYLNSSYGSNNVRVPQYTTPLVVDEFINFVAALNDPAGDEYVDYFYRKYFLVGNLGTISITELDNGKYAYEELTPEEGNVREIKSITGDLQRSIIRCGIMPRYDEIVTQLFNDNIYRVGGKPRRRTIRKRHHKRRTIKKSKRRRSSRSSKRCSR
jgi:hypothetical protein